MDDQWSRLDRELSVALQTVSSICANINHEQVLMDYVLIIPQRPFFEGARIVFDTTLEVCRLHNDLVSLRLCSGQVRMR